MFGTLLFFISYLIGKNTRIFWFFAKCETDFGVMDFNNKSPILADKLSTSRASFFGVYLALCQPNPKPLSICSFTFSFIAEFVTSTEIFAGPAQHLCANFLSRILLLQKLRLQKKSYSSAPTVPRVIFFVDSTQQSLSYFFRKSFWKFPDFMASMGKKNMKYWNFLLPTW